MKLYSEEPLFVKFSATAKEWPEWERIVVPNGKYHVQPPMQHRLVLKKASLSYYPPVLDTPGNEGKCGAENTFTFLGETMIEPKRLYEEMTRANYLAYSKCNCLPHDHFFLEATDAQTLHTERPKVDANGRVSDSHDGERAVDGMRFASLERAKNYSRQIEQHDGAQILTPIDRTGTLTLFQDTQGADTGATTRQLRVREDPVDYDFAFWSYANGTPNVGGDASSGVTLVNEDLGVDSVDNDFVVTPVGSTAMRGASTASGDFDDNGTNKSEFFINLVDPLLVSMSAGDTIEVRWTELAAATADSAPVRSDYLKPWEADYTSDAANFDLAQLDTNMIVLRVVDAEGHTLRELNRKGFMPDGYLVTLQCQFSYQVYAQDVEMPAHPRGGLTGYYKTAITDQHAP